MPAGNKKPARPRFGLLFRGLVSVLLIGWLLYKIDWSRLPAIVEKLSLGWMALGFIGYLPILFIVSARWGLLLRVHGARLRFYRIFELNMIGLFFSAFMLGTTGGDFFKIFYAARAVAQNRAAVGFTVLTDRVIGLLSLLFLGVVLSAGQLSMLLSRPGPRWATLTFYLFALGGLGLILVVSATPLFLRNDTLRALGPKLPGARRLAPIFAAFEQTARSWKINLAAFVLSLPSNAGFALMAYCVIRALHLHPPLLAFGSIVLIVYLLIAIPVSISGLGVRESLFVMFLGLLGIDRDHAFAFSITFFGVNLLWSLIGGAFYLLYRNETHEPSAHEAAELATRP